MKIRPCSTCSDSPPAGSMSSVRNSTCSEQKRQHSSLWNAFGTTWINAVPMQVYWQVSLDNIPIYLEKKLTWTGKNGNNFHIKKVFFLVIIFKKHVLIQYWHMSPFVHATKNEKKTRTCHGVHGKTTGSGPTNASSPKTCQQSASTALDPMGPMFFVSRHKT